MECRPRVAGQQLDGRTLAKVTLPFPDSGIFSLRPASSQLKSAVGRLSVCSLQFSYTRLGRSALRTRVTKTPNCQLSVCRLPTSVERMQNGRLVPSRPSSRSLTRSSSRKADRRRSLRALRENPRSHCRQSWSKPSWRQQLPERGCGHCPRCRSRPVSPRDHHRAWSARAR